jgi:enolase
MGFDASARLIDAEMLAWTAPRTRKLGANAILGVSLAVARAAADSADLPLFRYVGGPNAHVLPVPMMNILNGGAHADTNVDIQEFMIAPIGAEPSARRCAGAPRSTTRSRRCCKTGPVHRPRRRGWLRPQPRVQPRRARPHRRGHREGRLRPGKDIALALDVAATEFYEGRRLHLRGCAKTSAEMIAYYAELVDAYPLVSIEDPLNEEDWDGWKAITEPSAARSSSSATTCSSPTPSGCSAGIDTGRPTRCWSRSTRSARSPRRSTRSTWPTATATAA